MPASPSSEDLVIGVLALQGAFREHANHLARLSLPSTSSASPRSVKPLLVRSPAELEQCQGLVIPGGESTVIALSAHRAGLLEPLRQWVRDDKPTWGTCAGMILLAREASGGKKTGQEILGGIDVRVGRNGFGSQVDSFEQNLEIPALSALSNGAPAAPFPCIFIRAPIVDALLLPNDVLAVAPDEATQVRRGPGEPQAGAEVVKQSEDPNPSASTLKVAAAQVQDAAEGAKEGVANAAKALLNRPALSRNSSSFVSYSASGKPTTIVVAPPLEEPGEPRRPRPPLEILASLPSLPYKTSAPTTPAIGTPGSNAEQSQELTQSALDAISSKSDRLGRGTSDRPQPGEPANRPPHDAQIVAVKQGKLMATSFHPELSTDLRLHELFVRRCVLGEGEKAV